MGGQEISFSGNQATHCLAQYGRAKTWISTYQRQVDVVSLCQSLNLDSGLPGRSLWDGRPLGLLEVALHTPDWCLELFVMHQKDICGHPCRLFLGLYPCVCVLVPYKVSPGFIHVPDLAFDRRSTPLATPSPMNQ